MANAHTNLIVILGDQLSLTLSALEQSDKKDSRILMAEVRDETVYVPHHKKKIAFIFAAMRHHAETLRSQGWAVDYIRLDGPEPQASFTDAVSRTLEKHGCKRITVTEASEWRVQKMLESWADSFGVPVDILEDTRFLCSHEEFQSWASGRKQMRMEYFYREMRRKTGLLMNGETPEGDRWNFDSENRKPAKADLFMPKPLEYAPNTITKEVLTLVGERFNDNFGDLEPFWFAVDREGAKKALTHFIKYALPRFGDYQDAMLVGEAFLYHSVLSLYINVGLLDPLEVCRAAADSYQAGNAPLNATEGFIRQIIGWREYVRGIYWLKMPNYREMNALNATRPLPSFYWSGETDMRCIHEAVTDTKKHAYAHHIQRLMITGNFALLAGIDPFDVHEWYLAVYVDAFEWVELPNTLGMSQFADGGLLGSKPYAASGNYIKKMSDYCENCPYDVKVKTGENACPFNSLYWHFMDRNRDKLEDNPRIGRAYYTWDKMDEDKRVEYIETAEKFLEKLA